MSDEHWLCGRCLAVFDARTSIRAESIRDRKVTEPFPGSVTNMARLRLWAEEKVASGEWVIMVNDYSRAFAPVSTWHGDPVCEMHLRMLAQHELSGRWYQPPSVQ